MEFCGVGIAAENDDGAASGNNRWTVNGVFPEVLGCKRWRTFGDADRVVLVCARCTEVGDVPEGLGGKRWGRLGAVGWAALARARCTLVEGTDAAVVGCEGAVAAGSAA